MSIVRVNFNRIPYLGAFALATDKVVIVPPRFNIREQLVAEALGVKVVRADLHMSTLVGILATGNSEGILAPSLLEGGEEAVLVKSGLKVARVPSKHTAIGNLVLVNDHGALASPKLSNDAVALIEETLRVPVERGTIAKLENVGAAGVTTNKGALVHPDVSSEESKRIERILEVPVDVGTACGGVKYVGVCMVANSNGVLVGGTTTGPELGRIESALGFI